MSKELVVIEKEVLDELIETVRSMKEQLDDVDHYVRLCVDLVGPIAEKLHVA